DHEARIVAEAIQAVSHADLWLRVNPARRAVIGARRSVLLDGARPRSPKRASAWHQVYRGSKSRSRRVPRQPKRKIFWGQPPIEVATASFPQSRMDSPHTSLAVHEPRLRRVAWSD